LRINLVGHVCVFVGCVCCTPTGNHTGQPPANFAQAPSGADCARLATLCLRSAAPGRGAQIAKNPITEQTLHRPFALPTQPKKEKSSDKILELLKRQPALSANALAEKMNISSRAVEKQIGLLKKNGKLRRIGPAKGGRWNVES